MAESRTRPCFDCNFLNMLEAPACEHCGADLRGAPLQRDLKTEADLGAVSFWFRFSAVLILFSAWVIGFKFMDSWARSSISMGILLYLTGRYLARFHNGARVMGGFVGVFGILVTALGLCICLEIGHALMPLSIMLLAALTFPLVYSIAMARLLFGKSAARICSPGYRHQIPTGRGWRLGASPFFWPPFFIIALLVMTLMMITGQSIP